MNKAHENTLAAIFKTPVQTNINWRDCERLLEALGAKITEGSGSRVRVELEEIKTVFHRPHSRKEGCKGTVTSLKKFLTETNVKPI